MSALYIGNSKLDDFLLHQLEKKIETSPNLHVHLLIDHTRGTRVDKDGQSSFSVLRNLKQKVGKHYNSSIALRIMCKSVYSSTQMLATRRNRSCGEASGRYSAFITSKLLSLITLSYSLALTLTTHTTRIELTAAGSFATASRSQTTWTI